MKLTELRRTSFEIEFRSKPLSSPRTGTPGKRNRNPRTPGLLGLKLKRLSRGRLEHQGGVFLGLLLGRGYGRLDVIDRTGPVPLIQATAEKEAAKRYPEA
jgi:hypothetical protein